MFGMREVVNYTSRINFYVYGAEENPLAFIKENATFYEKICWTVENKILHTKK